MVAFLEDSQHGPACLVRIQKDGRPIRWSFALQPGEPRPQFYPEDLPFLPDLLCLVAWSDESGLSTSWASLPGEELGAFQAKLKEMLEGEDIPFGPREAAERLGRAGKKMGGGLWDELRSLIPPSLVEALSDTADGIFGREAPQKMVGHADTISAFLATQGWAQNPGPEPSGASLVRVFSKMGKERELTVRWFLGMGSIILKETVEQEW